MIRTLPLNYYLPSMTVPYSKINVYAKSIRGVHGYMLVADNLSTPDNGQYARPRMTVPYTKSPLKADNFAHAADFL